MGAGNACIHITADGRDNDGILDCSVLWDQGSDRARRSMAYGGGLILYGSHPRGRKPCRMGHERGSVGAP